MKRVNYTLIIVMIAGFFSCNKNDISAALQEPMALPQPEYFPPLQYRIENNPITKSRFELGKKLFYDTRLSATHTVSCASCHNQKDAFADAGNAVSTGINHLVGVRNSPPIMNLGWNPLYMWDGGIADLDLQSVAPLTNHVEMGTSVRAIIEKLSADKEYKLLFKKAFGEDEISTASFLKSLSQFMLMCVSNQSKYDSVKRRQADFDAAEQKGYALFQQHCNSCHSEPLFTSNQFKNNGTPTADSGRYLVTLRPNDLHTFKIPSLRNLKYTAPYMHNGFFATVEDVLKHYAEPKASAFADAALKKGIGISKEEQQQLLAFLNTLNDEKFIHNKLLSSP